MHIYFVIPSSNLSGPVKGAFAIANLLVRIHPVTIIFLKGEHLLDNLLENNINIITLKDKNNFIAKLISIRRILTNESRAKARLFSMCFSADLISIFLNDKVTTISSVRGNLYKNYFDTYSLPGYILAFFHILIQRFFHKNVVMNKHMYDQVKPFLNKRPYIIRNFIDENYVSQYFNESIDLNKPITFVFIGLLIKRKDPITLLKAIKKLSLTYVVKLHLIGDGPLISQINLFINRNKLNEVIEVHGFLKNPYEILSSSDVFVLPSHSEGTPRAALEALFLGIPCVLRNVEGNTELIDANLSNVFLFDSDKSLADSMIKAAKQSRSRPSRSNLLPISYRSNTVLSEYQNLID